ncbi:hypothetical protein BJX99DRAFT_255039 [Aspergillus californicus]
MTDHRVEDAAAYRYSDAGHHNNFSSLHRARVAVNKSSSPLEGPKLTTALTTKNIPYRERASASERSASSSPVKSLGQSHRDSSVTQFCLCQPDPKIPRPRNAFILYRQHYQGAVVAQNPGLANPDISKIIGEQWRKLPQVTKDEWKSLAEEEKARHQQQYPEYRYQPRRYGRDRNSRSLSSGISHNPPGSTICNRCGGRIMNPPASPDAVFSSKRPSQVDTAPSRSYNAEQAQAQRGIKLGSLDEAHASHSHQWRDGSQSPDSKRRRTNPSIPFKQDLRREKSPLGSPYSIPCFAARTESMSARGSIAHPMQGPRGIRPVKEHPQHHHHPDDSLKLPPLQTSATMSGSATPITPFSQENFNVEAAVMSIPFLNKIKLLAKISPSLPHTFRKGDPQRRGPVITVDGNDEALVKTVTDYLRQSLQKEGKFQTRIFDGPEIDRRREGSSEPDDMSDKKIDYFNRISQWQRISEEIKAFVKSETSRRSLEPTSEKEEDGSPKVSPRTIIPKTAELSISSPPPSSENDSEAASSPPESTNINPNAMPVAIVPRYQLTYADAYACMVPIADSYALLDHWQWMASLWRGNVGPDITVCIRECDMHEMKQCGGNPVEIRLQDAKTVVVRRPINSTKEIEEKVLKRLVFEIEDFLTQ